MYIKLLQKISGAMLLVLFSCSTLLAQERTVNGAVVDKATGQGLPGAVISLKGKPSNVASDAQGKFSIRLTPVDSIIVVSFIGYKREMVNVADQNYVTISMSANLNKDLNDVVVVGYGTQKRGDLTGSVATVDMKKISDLPVSSVTEALKGQIPGLNVTGGSQRPGDNATLSIRQQFGFSKDGSSTIPLVVIDDVIQLDPNTGLPTLDQLNNLDPSEIQSITVLRDAAAAIYGSRASQGAIIVKTKKGTIGAPKISYSGKFETNNSVSFEKTMNAYQYGVFANRFGRAAGWNNNNLFDSSELESMKSLDYDWLKKAWSAGGAAQNSVNVSGGSERATYFAGVSYYTQSPNLGNQDYKKWSFRTGVDVNVVNNLKFSATVAALTSKVNQSFTKISINDGAYTSGAEQTDYAVLLHMPKYIPWEYPVDGVTQYISPALGPIKNQNNPAGQNNISGWNYFALLNNGSFTGDNDNTYTSNFSLQYDVPFIKGLSLKASYGINYATNNNEQAMLGLMLAAAQNTNQAGSHLYTDASTWKVALNNNRSTVRYSDVIGKVQQGNFFATYDNKFGKSSISAMASVEKGQQDYEKKFMIYDQPIYGAYNGSSPSAGTLNISNSYVYKTQQGTLAYLGRVNYDYDNKYLFQFVFRSDASTKFAPANYWGFFPGVSAGWIISREDWFKEKFDWINFFKLRASWGKTGKDNVKPWRWIQTFTYAADKALAFGGNGGTLTNSLTPDATPNPNITWDKTIQKNIGVDINLLDNRLSLSYDRYWNNNYDMLMTLAGQVGVPITVGGGFAEQNYGAVKAWGSEFSATWRDTKGSFGYSIGVNFGSGNNRVTKWIPVAFDYPSNISTEEGHSLINPAWGYLVWKGTSQGDGLLRTDADIDAYWNYLSQRASAAGTTPAYFDITSKSGLKRGMLAYQDLGGSLDAINKTFAGPNGQIKDDGQDKTSLVKRNRSEGFVTNLGFSWKNLSLNTQISTSWGGYNSIDYIKQPTSSGQMFWTKESYLNDMYDTLDNVNGRWPNVAYYSYNSFQSDFWQISNFRCFVRSLVVGYSLPKRFAAKLKMDALRVSVAGYNLWDFYNPYPDKYRNMYDDPKAAYPTLRTWSVGINASF